VDHNPDVPDNDHGTHVAGILGADWIEDLDHENKEPLHSRTRKLRGVCPDINLIDVRVFRDDGRTDEFELLAAIQYLRWMNSRAGTMQVHGANLSLSLIHEVRRFACGRTPICDECDEAAAAGMVIVAAAGNRGFEMQEFEEVRSTDSYRSVSITDPGNANGVITVGATHRKRPHEYGVSYFSSRGPTGDGRLKPDVVAPGEKIYGPTPHNRAEYKDGTSMAAPHVSGAAAMLMARHTELIAQPERIKRILCETATDLQRERYFQGNGLVDILRALQSV
ncbi:MAG: S8 family peptidase, partial [Roseibium sp.]|uniref:S8 family peptidase n=1 Tax=Roseibium sp. TaxID=1936156 RepID=UPI002632F2A4